MCFSGPTRRPNGEGGSHCVAAAPAALRVVFGDIGTSPPFAFKGAFEYHGRPVVALFELQERCATGARPLNGGRRSAEDAREEQRSARARST